MLFVLLNKEQVSSGVEKETNKARQLLNDYNTVSSDISPSFSPLSLTDVLSPDAEIWQKHALEDISTTNTTIPLSLKKDITDAYLLMKRCEVELHLLSTEMHTALTYWQKSADNIKQNINAMKSDSSQYSMGVASLLQQRLWVIDLTHSRAQAAFGNIISASSLSASSESLNVSDQDSDSSDSDISDNDPESDIED